jgi:hypothetical protein
MAVRIRPFIVLPLLFLCVFTAAQEGHIFSYTETPLDSSEEPRIIQHLSWSAVDYIRNYEVIIERETDGKYSEVLRELVLETVLEFSFQPGKYRYRIQVYDLLGRPYGTPAWENFEIFAAIKPGMKNFSPKTLRLRKSETYTITITGNDFTEGTAPFLRSEKGDRGEIFPGSVSVDPSGQSMLLTFTKDQLEPGQYAVVIRNPGGLEASMANLRVASRTMTVNVSAGYAPVMPLYGSLFDFIGGTFLPVGAYARLGILPLERNWGILGVEFEPFWTNAEVSRDTYDVIFQLIGAHVNLFFSRPLLNNKLALNFRLGAGLTAVADFHLEYPGRNTETFLGYYLSGSGSVSLQYNFYKAFYAEAGAIYNHVVTANDPQLGSVRFTLGLGWQF